MKKLLFTFTLLLMAFMTHAATQINGIYYNLDSSTKTAEVTSGSNEYTGAVSIPSTVSYGGYSYRVTSIGDWAFYWCSGLTSVDIPNSVTSIGDYAFYWCYGLTSIDLPNSVTSIGEGAFWNCTYLTSIDIPNSVTDIGNLAFLECCDLTSVTIPNSVTSIGEGAFYGCSDLTSVIIPNSVTSIGERAFSFCSGLTSVTVDPSNPKYDSRNNCNAIIETATNTLISGCKNTTIPNSVTSIGDYAFAGCWDLTSVTIPNSVSKINQAAFAECSNLSTINIPNSVTSIGGSAFAGCTSLTSVTVENPTPVTIEQKTFSNRANATLYVPTGSKSAYQAADYWKEFKEIIEKNMSHDAGLGDVNGDGEISISDVTLLVDYLLEQAGDNFILANADVNKDGRISVSDAVSIIKLILEGEPEPQAYLTCPDDHHPHMIDLGLPSGTKWACCNVGADKPEAYGGYYAWGETEEKSYYDWSTYIHYDGSKSTCHNLGDDIVGTQYDVAHVKWGGSWVMPSYDQQRELLDNCTYEWTTVNGVNGGKLTSKTNGGSIFLPAAGYRWPDVVGHAGSYGHYWSSTQYSSSSGRAYDLDFGSGRAYWCSYHRYLGFSVRPVSR